MKHMRKLASCLLAFVMVFAMATTAFAQEVSVGGGNGSITISNAAKGETYTIYKLFDASVTGTPDGSIAYTGNIPDSLSAYFVKDSAGNITANDAAWNTTKTDVSEGLRSALASWTGDVTVTAAGGPVTSDGSVLSFTGLKYGYYVVTTSQGDRLITVDSTNPGATIVDKNRTLPNDLSKTVDDDNVNIGQTVTYTIKFKAANYSDNSANAKRIISYIIEDNQPDFLTSVNVTSIVVDNDGNTETTDDQVNVGVQQFENKKIVIDWYDEANSKHLYNNGATVIVTYTAVVTEKAAIDGDGNTNTVTVSWELEGDDIPSGGTLMDSETIYTYAIALKKVNDKGEALAGATFELPFSVKSTPDSTDGAYIYAGDASGEGFTNQLTTTVTTPSSDDDGVIVIKGVESRAENEDAYVITEVIAPKGYNKLSSPISVRPQKTGEQTTNTTFYLDENGDIVEQKTDKTVSVSVKIDDLAATPVLVVNNTGTELPSTGGMGTAVFYIVGGILVAGAVVLLIAKRRMNAGK